MEQQQRTLVDLERLSRAEQRAENLRKQLLDVTTKQADLEARRDQIDSDLRPENIERSVATYGSTRPEDVRAERRRQLENERNRVQSQLDLMASSRARLEAGVAAADLEVDTLRARIDTMAAAAGTSNANTNGQTETTPTPRPTTPAPGPSTDTDAAPSVTPR
jgi:chromosome segregation ATPase